MPARPALDAGCAPGEIHTRNRRSTLTPAPISTPDPRQVPVSRHTPRDISSTPQPTSEVPAQRRQPICSFRMYFASAVSST